MASVERDVRLLMLAASAGSADAWSYSGFGHAFVANMTGNTVLLGLAVFQPHGDMLHPVISLCSYAIGAMIGPLLTGKVQPGTLWSKAISWTLMLEAFLLMAAEAGWMGIQLRISHAPSLEVLLGTVALAIGIQSSTMVQLKIPGIVTTYITGTWTTMLGGLVRLARHEKQEAPEQEVELEKRLGMQAGVLSAYFFSVVLTGWLFRYKPLAAGVLPGVSVLLVALHALIYND